MVRRWERISVDFRWSLRVFVQELGLEQRGVSEVNSVKDTQFLDDVSIRYYVPFSVTM